MHVIFWRTIRSKFHVRRCICLSYNFMTSPSSPPALLFSGLYLGLFQNYFRNTLTKKKQGTNFFFPVKCNKFGVYILHNHPDVL